MTVSLSKEISFESSQQFGLEEEIVDEKRSTIKRLAKRNDEKRMEVLELETKLKDAKETIKKLQIDIEHAELLTKAFIREKERNCARANNAEDKLETIEYKLAIMGIRLESVLNMRNDDNIFSRCFKE